MSEPWCGRLVTVIMQAWWDGTAKPRSVDVVGQIMTVVCCHLIARGFPIGTLGTTKKVGEEETVLNL
jgi:hypothetical protein